MLLPASEVAVSITPLPELPPQNESIHLSALEAYLGHAGRLQGVAFWPRVAARIIDFVIHYAIAFCGGLFFGFVVVVAARLQHNPRGALLLRQHSNGMVLFVTALLGSIVLEAICEGFHGSTPGKFLLGFVVVQEDGSPCRPRAAFLRSFAYLLDGMFFGLIGYWSMSESPQQQRHGDKWAETIVGRRSEVAAENLRGGGTFVMVFLLAAMADSALMLTGLMMKALG